LIGPPLYPPLPDEYVAALAAMWTPL
jgi:hypothetical protein